MFNYGIQPIPLYFHLSSPSLDSQAMCRVGPSRVSCGTESCAVWDRVVCRVGPSRVSCGTESCAVWDRVVCRVRLVVYLVMRLITAQHASSVRGAANPVRRRHVTLLASDAGSQLTRRRRTARAVSRRLRRSRARALAGWVREWAECRRRVNTNSVRREWICV